MSNEMPDNNRLDKKEAAQEANGGSCRLPPCLASCSERPSSSPTWPELRSRPRLRQRGDESTNESLGIASPTARVEFGRRSMISSPTERSRRRKPTLSPPTCREMARARTALPPTSLRPRRHLDDDRDHRGGTTRSSSRWSNDRRGRRGQRRQPRKQSSTRWWRRSMPAWMKLSPRATSTRRRPREIKENALARATEIVNKERPARPGDRPRLAAPMPLQSQIAGGDALSDV